MKIVLGSGSPRRKELLCQMGFDFEVDPPLVDENVDGNNPKDIVKKIVTIKGEETYKKHHKDLVICADTIVVCDGFILGKPNDKDEARWMIKLLENNTHDVLTGVYIRSTINKKVFVCKTKVIVDEMTDEEIENYINTPEAYDKAGGYAIQGTFSKYIKEIKGDYYNVMGLPMNKSYKTIKEFIGEANE